MQPISGSKLIVAGVIVWKGKAYIPHRAQFDSGIIVDVNPVHVTELSVKEIAMAISVVKEAGHVRLPDPKTREEFLARGDPILLATKARSWKQLAKTGASYSIGWTENHVRIDMSKVDKQGRWEYDLDKVKTLPPDTSIEQIVEIIMDDLSTRPDALK